MARVWAQLWIRVPALLPLILPSILLSFGIVGMALLLLGKFYLWLILALGLPLAVGSMWLVWTIQLTGLRPGSRREQLRWDWIVIFGILLWTACNVPFAAQHVFTDRDPATYAVAGAWLVNHHDLDIPAPTSFMSVPTVHADSLGFGYSVYNPKVMYAQGAHMLPVLLGFFGKIFGQVSMLSFNVVFGGVALLAFYSFVRLVLKPQWAAVSTLVLGGTLPFIYFSRDTYTEPLTLLCIFSALACLWYACKSSSYRWWFLAGVFAGTSTLLRVDAYVLLAALEVYVGIYVATASHAQQKPRVLQAASAIVPAALLGLVGWFDVSQLSSGYYRDLRTHILAQIVLLLVLTIGLTIMVWAKWRTRLLGRLISVVQHKRTMWLLRVGLITFFIVLTGRALVLLALAIAGKNNVPVQTYSAGTTVLWIGWYIGPVLAVAGIYQLVRCWPELVRGMLPMLLPLAIIVSADCALYLLNPNITPDQVWASRRFLPVIFPGLIIFGMLALQQLAARKRLVWQYHWVSARKVALALAVLAAGVPLLTSLPFWFKRSLVELPQVVALCQALPANAVIVWVGDEGNFLTQPTAAFCGITSFSTTASGPALATLIPQLEHVAATQHQVIYLAANQAQAGILPSGISSKVVGKLTYIEPEHTYKRFPVRTISTTRALVLGAATQQ